MLYTGVNIHGKDIHTFYAAHVKKYSLLGVREDSDEILSSCYKFMVYRNPAERLVSAFRDKIEKYPLKGLLSYTPHFNLARQKIYKTNYPDKFEKWKAQGGKEEIHITFVEYINHWLDHSMNEHFSSIFGVCQPCQVRYSYYGKFSTYEQDMQVLMDHIGANTSHLAASYYEKKGKPTSELVTDYYKSLMREQKEAVIKKLAVDLLFYYTIFPEERDSHKVFMDTDIDVPDLL